MSSIVALFLMSLVGLLGGLFAAVFVALKVAAKHGWKPQFNLTFVHNTTTDAPQETSSPFAPEAGHEKGTKPQGAADGKEAKQADASSSSQTQPEGSLGMTAEYEREAFGPPNSTMEWGQDSYANQILRVWGADASRFRQDASGFVER